MKKAVKKAAKKAEVKKQTKVHDKPVVKPETNEQKLVKLLSGKEFFSLPEIIKATGYAEASAKMYVNQAYLDRKNKPYRVVAGKKNGVEGFRYEAK